MVPGALGSMRPRLNTSAHTVTIEHGERVAQVILNRFEVVPWVEGKVGVTTDRQGGFGSTGHA